jgi:hypothetical protein
MSKSKKYILIVLSLIIPFVLYYYFHFIKTICFYGDDIYLYMARSASNTIPDIIKSDLSLGKFRPIHATFTHLLFEYLQKNLAYYYFFNIAIQTLNVFLFARLLNLFLRSPLLSLFISIVVGLSRFTLFNITQLYNGGALEGLAITFMLLTLFFIFRPLVRDDYTASQKIKDMLLSILFANICLYTHERYIVLLPFLILVFLFFPALKTLTRKQKLGLSAVAVATIILHITIKKYVLSMPFFVGTGGTNITFSFSTALSFLIEGVLSIFQINTGPGYLSGISFMELSLFYKMLVALLLASLLSITAFYIIKLSKHHTLRELKNDTSFSISLSLLVLFFLLLAPAIVTIRLEHRWLQASFDIMVLLVAITISMLHFKNNYTRYALYALVFIPLILIDSRYLHKGFQNIYLYNSQQNALRFKKAIEKGVINPNTSNLYIWVKERDVNNEQGFKWDLGGGSLFKIYQNKSKNIIFADSIYDTSSPVAVSSFPNFNKNNDQILYVSPKGIIDITNEYLKDSLKSFTTKKIYQLESAENIEYDQKNLVIDNNNLDQFSVQGFYDNENGIRWTNGNVQMGFKGTFSAKDSVHIELNTFMPPACKNIHPAVSITDDNDKVYRPLYSGRSGDTFFYTFYFKELSSVQKISISADTIPVAPPDQRILSFPFVSLKIKVN